MNPVVLAVIGLGIGMIAFGGGGGESKTAQPTPGPTPGPSSGKPSKPSGEGGSSSGGGSSGGGEDAARRLQEAVNAYAAARGFYDWTPLAVDGVIGRNTRAALSLVLWSIEDLYPAAPPAPGVVLSGGDVSSVTDAGSLAVYISGYAETRPGTAPATPDPMDDLRSHYSSGLAAEREGDPSTAAEIYREVIMLAPEGSDLWRQASSRLAALRMRHGAGV